MPDEIKYFSASDLYDNLYKQQSVEEEEKESIAERKPVLPPAPSGGKWSGVPEKQAAAAEQQRIKEEHEARIYKPRFTGTDIRAVGGRDFERESAKKLAMESKISVAPLQFNEDGSIDAGRNIDRGGAGSYLHDTFIGSWTEGKIDPDRYAGYHITKNSDDNTAVDDYWLEQAAVAAERKARVDYPDQPFDHERFKKQLKAFTLAKAASNIAQMYDPGNDAKETVFQMVNGMPDDEKGDFFEAMLNVSNENQVQAGLFGRSWNAFYEKGFVETGESIGDAATQLGQWVGLINEDTEQDKLDQAEIDFAEYLIERQRKTTAPTGSEWLGGVEGAVTGALEIAPGMISGLGTGALAKKGAETALKVGAKGAGRAAVAGSTTFWWAQSKDAIYDQMVENGASTDSANAVSSIAAIPVAAIERFQVKSMKSSWFKNLKPNQQGRLKQAFDVVKQRNTSMSQKFIQGGKNLWQGTKSSTINAAKETAQEVAQESLTMIGEHIGNEINDLDVPIDVKGRIMETWEATGSSMLVLGATGRSIQSMSGRGKKNRTLKEIANRANVRETRGEEIADKVTGKIASGYQSDNEEDRMVSDQMVDRITEWVGDPSKENTKKLNSLKIPYDGEKVGLGDFLSIYGKSTGKKKAIEILRNSVGEKIGDKIVAGEVLQEKIDAIEKDVEAADGQAQKVVEAMTPYIAQDNKLKKDAIELVGAAKTSRNAFRDFILSDESVFNPDGSINSDVPRGRMILSIMETMEESERDAQQDADVLSQMDDGGKFISPSILIQMEKDNFEKWAVEQGASQQELSVHSREKLIDKYSEWANTRDRLRFLLPTNLEKAGLKTNLQREAFSSQLHDALVETVENVDAERDQEVNNAIEDLLQRKRKDDLRSVIQRQADELAVDEELEFEEGTEEAELLGEMQKERVEQGELISPESIQGVKDVAIKELESGGVSEDVAAQIAQDLDAIDSRDPIKRDNAQKRVMGFLNNQSLGRQSKIAKKDFVQDESQLKQAKQMGDQFRELVDAGYLENLNEWTDFDVEAMWEGSDLNTDAVFGTAVEVMLRQNQGEQLTDNQINEIIFEQHTGNKIQYRDASKKKAKKKKGDKQQELISKEAAQEAAEPQIVSAVDEINQFAVDVSKIDPLISDQDAEEAFNEIADDMIQTANESGMGREKFQAALKDTDLSNGEINLAMARYDNTAKADIEVEEVGEEAFEGEDVEVSDELQPIGEVFHGSAVESGSRRSGFADLVKTAGKDFTSANAGGVTELAADAQEFGEAVNQHFVISSLINKNAINLSQTKGEVDYSGRNSGSTHTIILPQKKKGAGTVSINPAKVIKQLNFESSARDYDAKESDERAEAPKLQLKNIKIADSIPQELAQQIADAIKSGKRVNIFYDPANQGKNIDVMSQVLDLLDSDTQWETTFATHAGGFNAKLVKVRFLKKGTERGAPNAETKFDISDQLISPAKTDPKAGARIQPEPEVETEAPPEKTVTRKQKQEKVVKEKFGDDLKEVELSSLELPKYSHKTKLENRLTGEAQKVQTVTYYDKTGKEITADIYQDLDSDGNKIYKAYREPKGDGKTSKTLVRGDENVRTIEEAYDKLWGNKDVKNFIGISKLQSKAPTLFNYRDDAQRQIISDSATGVADKLNDLLSNKIRFGEYDSIAGLESKQYTPENILKRTQEEVGNDPDFAVFFLEQLSEYVDQVSMELDAIDDQYLQAYGTYGKVPSLSEQKALADKGGTVGVKGTGGGIKSDRKRTKDSEVILEQSRQGVPQEIAEKYSGLDWGNQSETYYRQKEDKENLKELQKQLADIDFIVLESQGMQESVQFEKDENGKVTASFRGKVVDLSQEDSKEDSQEDPNAAFQEAATEEVESQQEKQSGPKVITTWDKEQLENSLKAAAAYGNTYLDILGRDEDNPLTSDQKFDSKLMDTANAASTSVLGDGDTFVLQTIEGVQVDTTASKNNQRNDVAISLVWNKMFDKYSIAVTYADGEYYNNIVAVNMARDEWIDKQAQEQQDLTLGELTSKDLKMWQDEHRSYIEKAREVLPDSQFPSVVQAQYPDLFNKDFIKQEEVLEKAWNEQEIEEFNEALEIVVDDFIDDAIVESNGDPKILRGLIKQALSDHEDTLMNLANSSYKIENKVLRKFKTEDGVAWILDNWHGVLKRVVEARKEDLKRPESFLADEEDREVQDLKVTASNLYAAVGRAQEEGNIEQAEKLLASYEEAQAKAEEAERKYNEKYDPEAGIEETPKDRAERLDKQQAELEQPEQQKEDFSYRDGLWMPKPASYKERVPAKLEFRSDGQRITFEDGDPYHNTVRQSGSTSPGVHFIAEYENGFILLTEKEYNARYGWAHSYNKADWHRFEGGKRYLVQATSGNTLPDKRNPETGEWVEPETNLGEFLGFVPVSESRYGKAAILHESGPFYYNDKLNENSKYSATAERLKHVQKIYELLPIDITEGAMGQDNVTDTTYNDIILSATSIADLVSEGKSWQEAFEEVVGESDKVAADIKKFTGLEAGELFKQIMEGPDPSKPLKTEGGFELGREMREQRAPDPIADVDLNDMPDTFQLEQQVERPSQPEFDNTGKGSEKRMFEGMDADPKQTDLDFEARITVPDKLAKQVMAEVSKLTAADIQEAFPGSVVTETEFGFEIKLGDNRVPIVFRTAVTVSEKGARNIWKNSYSKLPGWEAYTEQDFVDSMTSEGGQGLMIIPVAGTKDVAPMERLGILGLMQVKAGQNRRETLSTIRHELVHLAFDTGLWTEQEKAALVRRFSDPNASRAQQSEDIAIALEYWKEPGVLQKFADWINEILHKLTGGTLTLSNSDVQRLLTSESVWQRDPSAKVKPTDWGEPQIGSDISLSADPERSPYLEKKKELKKVKRAIARAIKKGDDVEEERLLEQRKQLILDLEKIIRENARNIPGMRPEQMDIGESVLEGLAKEFDTEYDELVKGWLKRKSKSNFAKVRQVSRDTFAKTISDVPKTLSAFILEAYDVPAKSGTAKRKIMRKLKEAKMGFMNYHNQQRARSMSKMDKARKKLTTKDLNPILKEYFFKYLTGTKGLQGGLSIGDALKKYIPDSSKRESIVEALREYEEALNEARSHIDALSEEGINIGLFQRPGEDLNLLEITIDENLGYYVNRSYALFETPAKYHDFLQNTTEGKALVKRAAAKVYEQNQGEDRVKAEIAAIRELFKKDGLFYEEGKKKRKEIRADIAAVIKGLDKLPDGRRISAERAAEIKEKMNSDAFKEDGPKYKSIVTQEMSRYKTSMMMTPNGQKEVENQLGDMDLATEQEALDEVNRIIEGHYNSAMGSVSGAEQDLGVLQERKKINKEFLELFGEVRDAPASYAITTGKLAQMISINSLQKSIVKSGIFGGQLRTPEQGSAPNITTELLGPQWGALEGYWVHKDAMKAINEISGRGGKIGELMRGDGPVGYILTGMVAMSNAARMNKTVLSAKTVSRNMTEALIQGFINGSFSLGRLSQSYATASYIAGEKNPALKWGMNPTVATLDKLLQFNKDYKVDEELSEFLVKSGVVGNDDWRVVEEQIQMTLDQFSDVNSLIPDGVAKEQDDRKILEKFSDFIKSNKGDPSVPNATRRERARRKFNELIGYITNNKLVKDQGSMYRIPDDVLKVNTFLTEVSILTRAYAGTKTKMQIWEEAGERTKRTTPTATRVPKLVKALSAVPLFGNFPVWTTSFIQSTVGAYQIAYEDIKSGNQVLRRSGQMRLARISFMNFGVSTLASILMSLMFDDEEEEQIRSMLPEWSKNHTIIPWIDDDGTLQILDVSQTLPHVMFADIARAGLSKFSDRGLGGALEGVFGQALEPYFDEDIFWSSFKDAWTGTNQFGKQVYSPFDSTSTKWLKGLEYVTIGGRGKDDEFFSLNRDWRGPLAPGTIAEMKRTYEAAFDEGNPRSPIKRTPIGQASRWLIGTELMQINVKNQLTVKFSEFKRALSDNTGWIRKAGYNDNSSVFKKHLARFRKEEALLHKELLNAVGGARMAGMSDVEIVRALQEYGATKTDLRHWINGVSRKYVPGKDTLRAILKTDEGKEKVKALIKRGDPGE